MERGTSRSNYEVQERLTVTSGDHGQEHLNRPGPLTIAMGEVEKLREYLQNGYRSSNEDIFIDDDGNSAKSYSNQDELITCLMVMKRLMEEAEEESMRLKEEKRVLTQKIGESLNSVNKEMENLRNQLQEQDRRLSELGGVRSTNKNITFCNGDDSYQQEYGMTAANFMGEKARQIMDALHDKAIELEKENHILNEEVYVLRNEITKMPCSHCDDWKECVNELQLELKRSKDSITILKRERKKTKAEKLDLLDQMKQLYGTLEDKERELRDFIINYEQRMKDSEEAITELVSEKDRIQKERWEILRHATETTERSVALKSQVDDLEDQLKAKDVELAAAKALIETMKPSITGTVESPEASSSRLGSDNRHSSCGIYDTSDELAADPKSLDVSQDHLPETKVETPPRMSSTPGSISGDTQYLSLNHADSTPHMNHSSRRPRTYHPNSTSDDVFPSLYKGEDAVIPRALSSRRRRTLSSALSKVFQKGSTEDTSAQGPETTAEGWRTGVDERTINKWEIWDQMQKEPMSKWKADAVIVWLEVECCMGMYSQKCYENIKSGKLLLELSDQELASALNITNPMHKLKLKLAIDDHKHPERKDPRLSKLDHVWVSYTFLRDLGLGPYAPIFENNLVDGRMLNLVSKKDLEKHLGILKKSHQASFMHGLELLKMLHFDKDALHIRRSNCVDTNIDLVVWTNERVTKWISSIDLKEYADNLQDSGIHGAHMVLDSSFGADTMAAALQIPNDKQMVFKHLNSELTTLLNTARNSPNLPSHLKWSKGKKPIGRSFSLKWHRKSSADNPKQRRISTSKSSGTLPTSSAKSGTGDNKVVENGDRKVTML